MKRLFRFIAALSLMAAASAQVSAYTTTSCGSGDVSWSSKFRYLYAYTGSFPSGSSYRTALEEAVDRLNDNASGFTFYIIYTSTAPALGNGRSEVWIENISPPGVTNYWWNGSCNMTEADIRMDSSVTWTTSIVKTTNFNYGGSGRPFQTTLLHELGHAIGLGHEADEYNIMGQDWDHIHTNGNYSRAYFGEDASDGSVYLYGAGSGQDLGVVHWKWTGASGAYSAHGRTRLLDPSTGSELSYTVVGGERRYNVVRGQNVRMELTYENNGNSYQYQDVNYYISTNSTVSTWDTLLASRNLGLSPDNVYTSTYDVTIPSNVSCNTPHWLGAVMDPDGSVSELAEWNNATYIPVYVNWTFSCLVITPTLEVTPIQP
ncbi:matrixin family metalloprotease [Hahella ganghwensis]|uniref:matrixin family metalloprotease n=1 Tax=Hahella ganghwensis TaxID=286420 RepID=UPI000363AC5B|nr:matrixin family metalloprotease [Hahella ganghwensis]